MENSFRCHTFIIIKPTKNQITLMKVKISLLIFFAFFTVTAFSQDITVRTKVSTDIIGYFDILKVSFEANSNEVTLREPYFEDFTIYKGRDTKIEQSYLNGKTTSKTIISYLLKPKRTGELTIDRAVFEYDAKVFATDPVTIIVKGDTLTNDPSKKDNKIFVFAQVSNYTPFCYQPVMIEYKLYFDADIKPSTIGFDFKKEYTDNFLIYAITSGESVNTEVVNGKKFNSIVIKKDVIRFKNQDEISINNNVVVEYKTSKPTKDDENADQISEKSLPVVSNKIKSKKMEKTPNFPHDIQSYGDYKLDVFFPEYTIIKKNKIFEITVQLYGEGYIEDEILPQLSIPKGFEVISNTIVNDPVMEDEKIKSVATRTYKIKPLAIGSYKFRPVSFYFYNEKIKQRKAVSSKEFTLTVK